MEGCITVSSVRGFDYMYIQIYICMVFPYHFSMCFILFSLRKELFFSDHSGVYVCFPFHISKELTSFYKARLDFVTSYNRK